LKKGPSVTDMSISACPSIEPTKPLSACLLAASRSLGPRKARNSSTSSTIMMGPPTNSPRVNSHPRRIAMMIPSSMTRLVEANSKTIAAVKSAPLRKIERARATAAYEHDDEAAPRPHAIPSERAESSGRSRVISALETTACTAAERTKPSTRAQSISQHIPKARERASSKLMITLISLPLRVCT
jgi:hypothetical protein